MWARTYFPFPCVTYLNQSSVGSLSIHRMLTWYCVERLERTAQAQGQGSFGYTQQQPANHLFVMLPENVCPLYFTQHFMRRLKLFFLPYYIKKSFCISHHYPIPSTPCSKSSELMFVQVMGKTPILKVSLEPKIQSINWQPHSSSAYQTSL